MKRTSKITLAFLLSVFVMQASSKNPFTVVEGDPLVLLQENKKAAYEIDYSNLIITNGKPEEDVDFYTWMKLQDEDEDSWTKDWEKEDKNECDKEFRDNFNDEIKHGIRLSKYGTDYKVILRFNKIDLGPAVKMTFTGMRGGEALATGVLEVRDFNTDEIVTVLAFTYLKGESSFKQIGRLIGLFENLGEQLSDFLKDYKKSHRNR